MRRSKAESELQTLAEALAKGVCDALQADLPRPPIAAGYTRLGKVEFLYPSIESTGIEDISDHQLEESLLIRIRQRRYSSAARLENTRFTHKTEIRIHAEHRAPIARIFLISFRRKRPKRITVAESRETMSANRWFPNE